MNIRNEGEYHHCSYRLKDKSIYEKMYAKKLGIDTNYQNSLKMK
jgi:hypothetical protein